MPTAAGPADGVDCRRRTAPSGRLAPRCMPTYRLTVEYDGTRFHGWQIQQNARSIAGELQRALVDAGCEVVELGGSGRTDAGVHALAQVAHLRLRARRDPARLQRELNDRLPPDVHVLSVAQAAERFHARHDAISRSYVYQLATRRTAFAKRFVWWVRQPLDLAAMQAAAGLFAGRHDFSAFCERPKEQTSTLVEVERVEVVEAESLLLVRVVASHFLWKMVRRLVGTLVQVGRGELAPAAVAALLDGSATPPVARQAGAKGARVSAAAGEGGPAEWTAPPSGLFLERVLYPGEGPLPPVRPVTPVALPPR
jgi:tRNA pseudouridine38-40 synthase